MSVRTAYLVDEQLYISYGPPDPEGSFAFTEECLAIQWGENRWLERWAGLDELSFRLRGIALAAAAAPARVAVRTLHWIVALFVLVVSFGWFGGELLPGKGEVRVTVYSKGKPRAFSRAYSSAIAWPNRPTELEKCWFIAVADAMCGRRALLDVVGLSNLLGEVSDVSELQERLPEVISVAPK